MKKENQALSLRQLILFVLIPCVLSMSALVVAALSHTPQERGEGIAAETVTPGIIGKGESAQVIIPEAIGEDSEQNKPFEPFIPEFTDSDPFIDMEQSRDFSTQYSYDSNMILPCKYGAANVENGVYTATAQSSIFASTSQSSPFPYGTISADVMNNGSDSGIIFGLSSTSGVFWEGSGTSYYFAFISYEGILFLGRTVNGVWSTLTYVDIEGFKADNTYNLKVLYRVDKVVLFLNDVPMLSYRANSPLEGTGWGIRMGTVGAQISNISISSKVSAE